MADTAHDAVCAMTTSTTTTIDQQDGKWNSLIVHGSMDVSRNANLNDYVGNSLVRINLLSVKANAAGYQHHRHRHHSR
jgi:hypothetical protein